MSFRIYHNPRCSKSRQTLALLSESGIDPEIVEYLSSPPSAEEIQAIARSLGIHPRELSRAGDAEKAGLTHALASASDAEAADLLHRNPALIERPIVVRDDGAAAVGRPPENVKALL